MCSSVSPYVSHGLPVPLTPLVGQARAGVAVCDMLRDPGVRLVTLTGPGGVGKTRLALAVAHRMAVERPNDVRFVGLAGLTDPALVIPTIAQALEVSEAGSVPVFERLLSALRHRDVLLVLDNLEHLIDATTQLAAMLRHAPQLTLLVTSRQVLHLSGEREYPVEPLALPPLVASTPSDVIAQSDAVALFVERARAVRPDFTLSDENATAVAAICARLDGLPLAIELAAARIRLLPPRGLLARLDHRLALLTGGARDLPERQQTLRNTIAWSYDLLDPAEQLLFRRLAVCAGGCSLDAAAAVALDQGDDQFVLLDRLSALIERSLLRQSTDSDGAPRFTMLATIREFATAELERSGEAGDIRDRHARWCLALAESSYNRVLGPESRQCVGRLEADYDNLRAAIAWSLDAGRPAISHGLIGALGQFWYLRGYLSEGRQWCARARASTGDVPSILHAKVAGMEAFLRWAQGDYAEAANMLDEVIAIPELADDPSFLANMLIVRGVVAEDRGDFERAEHLHAEAAGIFRAVGEPVFVGYALTGLGVAAYHRDDDERAGELFAEALALEQEVGNAYGIGLVLINLARLARDRGDDAIAIEYYRESLRLRVEHGGLIGVAGCLRGLASVAVARDEWEHATRLYAAAAALTDAVGAPVPPLARGRYGQALATLRASVGEKRFDAVWSEGQALTAEQAVALALEGNPRRVSDVEMAPSSPGMTLAPAGLTARELDVLRQIADGQTDREIALALSISVRTVSSHVTSILTKLNVNSRSAAAAWAVRHGVA